MPSSFIGTSIDNCYPGTLTRYPLSTTVESRMASEPVFFGQAVMMTNGTIKPLAGSVVGNDCYGIVNREFPSMGVKASTTSKLPGPQINKAIPIMRMGYIAVLFNMKDVTPILSGMPVYVITTAGGDFAVGDYVATSTPTGAVATAINATYSGPIDANGYIEITFGIGR